MTFVAIGLGMIVVPLTIFVVCSVSMIAWEEGGWVGLVSLAWAACALGLICYGVYGGTWF